MAWLDDRIRDHPKFVTLSAEAFRQWAYALCYCSEHATGGRLAAAILALRIPRRYVDELVDAGIWDDESDGLWVHDWQEYNEKREASVEEKRAQARERQRRHRDKIRSSTVTRDSHATSRVTQRDKQRDAERDSVPGRPPAPPRAHAGPRPNDHDQENDHITQDPEVESRDHSSSSTQAARPTVDDDERNEVDRLRIRNADIEAAAKAKITSSSVTDSDDQASLLLDELRQLRPTEDHIRRWTIAVDEDHPRVAACLAYARTHAKTNVVQYLDTLIESGSWPQAGDPRRSHTQRHPYMCEECTSTFKNPQRLAQHQADVHGRYAHEPAPPPPDLVDRARQAAPSDADEEPRPPRKQTTSQPPATIPNQPQPAA